MDKIKKIESWEDYENIVRLVYEKLGENIDIRILCSGRNCKCKGKSGVEHQIDILTSHTYGVHEVKTAIECKYWNSRVSKDAIMKLESIMKDCNIEVGVIASKEGFTQDAIQYARSTNIRLIELREPQDSDWKGRVRKIIFNITAVVPDFGGFIVREENQDDWKDTELLEQEIRTEEILIQFPNKEQKTFKEVFEEESTKILDYFQDKDVQDKNIKISFPIGTVLIVKNRKLPVDGFIIKIVTSAESVEIDGEEHVFLILKSILEERYIVIDGSVHQSV